MTENMKPSINLLARSFKTSRILFKNLKNTTAIRTVKLHYMPIKEHRNHDPKT